MELEDDLDFKDRHPSNRFRIIGIVHYDGEKKVFIPATVRYAKKRLFLLCYSVDKPCDYELVSIAVFLTTLDPMGKLGFGRFRTTLLYVQSFRLD